MKCETPSKTKDVTATHLPLMEAFYSIQGEGYYQGEAAYFIRLAGCDVGCHWCDVKESWNVEDHPVVPVEDIVTVAAESGSDKAIITGGEPLMHDNTYLCQQLGELGIQRHIETSGAYPITGEWDWICLSPKKFKAPLIEVCQQADELKVVIYNRSDFAWAESFLEKASPDCRLYLQPEWSKKDQMMPLIVDYVKLNPKWGISLQIHKYMSVP